MKLSVVLPSWNVAAELVTTLAALEREIQQVAFDVETIVVDDASSDGSVEAVRARFGDSVRLFVHAENRGFAPTVNAGVAHATGDLLLLLNADCALEPGALSALVEALEQDPSLSAVAPSLFDPDGTPQAACMRFPRLWTPLFHGGPLESLWPESPELARYFARDLEPVGDADVEQPPAACLCLRRRDFEELGGFDEQLALFFNDVDLCQRLWARGGRIRRLGRARARHAVGSSTRQLADFAARWHADRYRYHRRHFGRLGGTVAKVATTGVFCQFALRQWGRRLSGHPAEAVGPRLRAVGSFLLRGAA